MSRVSQKEAVKGSQKWLQQLVNRHQSHIDNSLSQSLQLGAGDTINWLSPRKDDDYAEYRDEAFLKLLSVRLESKKLQEFWPIGGPVWDGLANTNRGDIILVEAKSHISEMASSCQAESKTASLIDASLAEAACHYGATPPANWSKGYYQYANRLAHLYLLRELNSIPAWLVFVYFVNDTAVAGPTSIEGWQSAITTVHNYLGVSPDQLGPNVVDLFVDVEALG